MSGISGPVEAGAKTWFDRVQSVRRDDGRKAPDGGPWTWEHLTEDDRRAYRALVEPIVTAALEWSGDPWLPLLTDEHDIAGLMSDEVTS